MKKALLIVDVQNDFCPGGALAVPAGNEVVEPLNKLAEYAKANGWLIFASRDWHPSATTHFKLYGGIWPEHCVQNTEGSAFHRGLDIKDAVIISKGVRPDEDGYSPFDGHTDSGESFEQVLATFGVTELYIGGLATDYCVKAAVLDAAKKGFKVFLLFDACRAVNVNRDDGEKAVDEMVGAGAMLTNTQGVLHGLHN